MIQRKTLVFFSNAFFISLVSACGQTPLERVEYPVYALGNSTHTTTTDEGFDVTLTSARVGLGPIYFCATQAASSDLCPTAVQEFASTSVVDALDPTPQRMGIVRGTTGSIESAAYDFAIPWFNSSNNPQPKSGAPGGHSAHFEGVAERDDVTFSFSIDVDIVSSIRGSRVVHGQRMQVQIDADDVELTIALSPADWFARVDFSEFDELDLDTGIVFEVPANSRATNTLILAMTTQNPPQFSWTD